MKGPKVVLIGAGSVFFGRQFIWAMVHSDILSNGTAALVDTNAARLDKMVKLAQKAVESSSSHLKIEWSQNHTDVLDDADFVVLSFAKEGLRYREIDCQISEKHGVRMCSGDTIGPGGIFRAMRELPQILDIANDIKRICPEAWVINYINPTAVNGIGLMRYSGVKSFALCDAHHMPHIKKDYLNLIGPKYDNIDKLSLTIAGVNHFTWLLDIKYDGKDTEAELRKGIETLADTEKDEDSSNLNYSYSRTLWDIFGKYPTCIGHTKEYLPFWQNKGVLPDLPAPLDIFNISDRKPMHDTMWEEINGYISGNVDIEQFHSKYKPDHATDIIEAMWAGGKTPFYINTPNRGAVSNLPEDAFLELLCDVNMDGPTPRSAGAFPIGLRALQMQVLDTHELTVEAIVKSDRKLLRRAMLTDPIVNSIPDADAIIEELLSLERGDLPVEWFK